MPLSVGTRKRTFVTNLLRCPKARRTKIIWAALVLLTLNLLYVHVDVSLATGIQQVHDDFSRKQDSFEEARQVDNGVNSDERTAEEHRKQVSSLKPDEGKFEEKTDESLKLDELMINDTMRSGNRLKQNEIALDEGRVPDDNLSSDKYAVEKNVQPDHGLMPDESVIHEKREPGDDPQFYEDAMNDTTQLADDLVSDERAIKESKQQAHGLRQDEEVAKQEEHPSDSLKTDKKKASQEKQMYSTHDQRAAWVRRMQRLLHKPPEAVMPTIFDVCPKACRAMTRLNMSKELPLMNVERYDTDPKSVSLDDPPIPIIGTDRVHQRIVSGLDVADFIAHVTMWRRVFHGSGGIGVFISCRVTDAVPLLKTLRNDEWFRNETEGGLMGNETWDILLLGAGRPGAVPGGSIDKRAISQSRIDDGDVLGYAVSQRGANRLLRHVRAFTVPARIFMSAVVERDLKVMRWDGAGLGEVRACAGSQGEKKDSAKFPFYPPVHWIHAAARDRKR